MLTQKRLAVIDEINRYGLALYDGHSEWRFLRRMQKLGALTSYRLFGKVLYYRQAGDPSLGPQELPIRFAIAWFCRSEGFTVPHPWERESAFPWLPRGVLVATGKGGLAVFKVDMGSKPDALARKAVEIHERLLTLDSYLPNKPTVWVLTGTEHKGREIQHYLNRSEHRAYLRVSVIPDYANLCGELTHAGHRQAHAR